MTATTRTARTINRVLVANRGEIAHRIIRACRDARIESVAVHSDSDANLPYVRAADHAVALGGDTAAETYLQIPRLLAVAEQCGADAVHPGYGFLAENAAFATAVESERITWIGPPPEVIRDLGDKVRARAIAAAAGVPLLAGTARPVDDAAEAVAFAEQHGLPIVIKAAFGGGGRGMRVARTLREVADKFALATREATAAFGRGECFVEAYLDGARHVEAQILADKHGAVRVIGTRDCTVQRRYQKIIEEAPAPFLDGRDIAQIEAAAMSLCRRIGYVNAGTVEFLRAPGGRLAFLEVNARLQVEHTVTEESTGVDIVRAQLAIAAGARLDSILPAGPGPSRPHGGTSRCSIELRITAEDPLQEFIPASGVITRFRPPGGAGVRIDAGVEEGTLVGQHYDSLLAKLTVTGRDRSEALERARRALAEFEITGVRTTLPFLQSLVDNPVFASTSADSFGVHTRWVEDQAQPDFVAEHASSVPDDRVSVRIGERWLSVAVPGLVGVAGPRLAAAARAATGPGPADGRPADGSLTAAMQGTVTSVLVREGERVTTGQTLVVIEAMKMANPLHAPHPGVVRSLFVREGDTVAAGTPIGEIETAQA